MSLPDTRTKQTKKLLTLIQAWKDTEKQWVQAELALDNLDEQLKAATGSCTEFIDICTAAIGPRKAGETLWLLQQKIKAAILKTKKLQNDILAELEGHQKKFYQFRLEIEKSLLELTSMPANLTKGYVPYFRWDEVVRWTIELHTGLCASIQAKKENLPFDSPSATVSLLLVVATSSNQLHLKNYVLSQLRKLVGTPDETIENVTEILSGHQIEIANLDLLVRVKNSDVLDYILSNVSFATVEKKKSAIKKVIHSARLRKSYKPGTAEQRILIVCLKHAKSLSDGSHIANQFTQIFYNAIYEGDLELVQAFVEAGVCLASIDVFNVQYLCKNQVQIVKFLILSGLPKYTASHFVRSLFSLPEFLETDFEFFIEFGLPLDFAFTQTNVLRFEMEDILNPDSLCIFVSESWEQNWLEVAMIFGRLDIAQAAYKLSLRISNCEYKGKNICAYFAAEVTDLARFILVMNHESKLLHILAGLDDKCSILYQFPKEIVLKEIGRYLYELEVYEQAADLFETEVSDEANS